MKLKNYNKIYEKIIRVILVNLNWYKSIIKREKIPFKEVILINMPLAKIIEITGISKSNLELVQKEI